ncbi:MAG TPA: hypothetical protein VN830_08450 [Verrucomicrobiae bacterium]|nr:hypothetical protein [Verrucomicrobiae bacterium]
MTGPLPSTSFHAKPRIPAWAVAIAISFLLSVAIVLPFFWLGSASGHDFEFHAASWLDTAFQWKQGIVYPRWTAWMNHGFGEPRFIFYPPLSWILGAALSLVLPGMWIPLVFIVLVQTFAGFSAFSLLRRLVSDRAAILGAACYVINPNALLLTYIRSDFAEQLACAFFPLLLLATLRLANLLAPPSRKSSPLVSFAIPFAAVWLANAPAGVIATYSLALLFAWAAITQRSWKIAFRSVSGLALGFGLTCFYLIPAAYEQRWVNIGQALASGLLPSQNFLFTYIADAEHTWFNWIASCCAMLLFLLCAVAALVSRRFASFAKSGDPHRKAWLALLVLAAVASVLILRFTTPLWNFLPKLRFVQFPWRWMSVLAVVGACFLADALQKRRGWIWVVLLLLLSVPLANFLVNNTWWDPDEIPTLQAAITDETGFDGTDEYDPLGDDHTDLPPNAPPTKILPAQPEDARVPDTHVQIQKWTTEEKALRVDSPAPARLALRLLNYPAWRVEVNGARIVPGRLDNFEQMVIPIVAGSSTIHVRFARTPDRTLGMLISILSVLLAIVLLLVATNRGSARA